LKEHYCGESPFGNGPDDGCNYKKPVRSGAELTASFSCEWDEAAQKSRCNQFGQPSPENRALLLSELYRKGLPAGTEDDVAYTVIESPSGWTLMSAVYQHIEGADLAVCEAVVALYKDGPAHVLRTIKLQHANADAPEVTIWSPLDIADVDGDGQPEILLRGDAYEDHWLEVIRIQGDSAETIFSGLGYYL
jgi:hypothetical protein